ncbi:hypothetical protein ACJX0J_002732 (mitochondrion) [Zea mays]
MNGILFSLNPNTSIMIDIDLKGLAVLTIPVVIDRIPYGDTLKKKRLVRVSQKSLGKKALGERKTLFSAHIPFLDIISEVVDATERGIVQVLSLFSFGDFLPIYPEYLPIPNPSSFLDVKKNSHRGLRELLIKRYKLFSFPYH